MKVDLIIIGAGPAGLFTAIQAASKNKNILILEKKPTPAKKLLITGSGQCNLTQAGDISDFFAHYGENSDFLKGSLYSFDNLALLRFFRKRGIEFETREGSKIFPKSGKAKDILEVLVKEIKNLGIKIKYNQQVKELSCDQKTNVFKVSTSTQNYFADFVVVAAGGKSYPTTGSTGDAYKFASSLGHSIKKVKPALTPVKIKNYKFSELAGISLSNIELSLWRDNNLIKRWTGDLLFTHQGLSGPAILNYSRYIKKGDLIKVHLVDKKNEALLDKLLIEKINNYGNRLFKNVLKDFEIPNRLADILIKISKIDQAKKAAQITKNERKRILKLLYGLSLEVEDLGSFKEAMVTKGGVNLKEIDPSTMESKLKNGLFVVGEALDIDGDTGGYNLQAAFSTAYLAGRKIAKS
ncbi:NAD(P)/FAD-dependent oxidoreductase [Halanaerobium hydrogeniformans]|uniref:HI0933 family protein n=1 Tax=Halanaerobium hydrogeniformans TaxID=656519 RepID=E4RLM1_HALHG|nr:NAD(P)/FAD-dependent oxidoreductase [Halanaerobium hydrogeniformans]ADQ14935.1 HI0933 family protein [Halanaerobium hydrogeniformans]